METVLLDTRIVRELMGVTLDSDNRFIRELFDVFTHDALAALERMRRHALLGDAAALARDAHRLKGSSATVGAVCLSGACLAIERSAKAGVCDGLDAHISGALDILNATRVALAKFFRGTIAATA